jgi:hypothetical protein
VHISARDSRWPYRGIISDGHIADDYGCLVNIDIISKPWLFVLITAYSHKY